MLRKVIAIAALFAICTSCYKTDPVVLELLKQIQSQNEVLKNQIVAMQKTTDSLSKNLSSFTLNYNSQTKQLDSIKNQLSIVLNQINLLNSQLVNTNSNIAEIQAKLIALQATCDQLLKLLNSCCNNGTNPSGGLILYLPFSGNAKDSSGNKNDGYAANVVLTKDRFDNLNSAYEFNGTNSYIDILNNFFDNGLPEYSISVWFNTNLIANPLGAGLTIINTNPHNGFDLGFSYNGSQKIYHWKSSNPSLGWSILSNDELNFSGVQLNKWYHVVVVKKKFIYQYYVNGVLDKTTNVSTEPESILMNLRIGALPDNTERFNGKIDDVRIYNRSLSQDEISYLASH